MKHVKVNDFVIHLRSFQGGIEWSGFQGKVSPAYTVLSPRECVEPAFFRYCLKSRGYIETIASLTDQLRDGQSMRYYDFGKTPLPLPPIVEQQAIANFLDRETAEIDAFIADQEELITLLAERRTATITHAVTKGLDPSVQMRESGVEWLGNVPTHWSVAAIRNAYLVLDCKHVTAEYVDGGDFPLASIREVKSKFVDLTMARRTTRTFYELLTSEGRKPSGGDLIISRNASVGQVAMVAEETRDFCMGQDVSLIRATSSSQSSAFLQYVLESDPGIVGMTMAMIGSTFKRINVSDIKSLPVVLPPIQEQLAIVEILDRETAEIDAAITDAREAIALSKERRAAVISAAVTGKIDVRGLVAPAVNEVEVDSVGVA